MMDLFATFIFFCFFALPNILGAYLGHKIEQSKTLEQRIDDNIKIFNIRYRRYKERMKNYDYYVKCKKNEWHLVSWQYEEYKYLRDTSVKTLYEDFKKKEQEIMERYNG